jgi:dTDP-glucose 4,6-dehydratase
MRVSSLIYPSNFSLIYKDLTRDSLVDLMKDIDAIVHFAAKTHVDFSLIDKESYLQDNIFGTYRLLEASKSFDNIKKFIYVSSDEIYGEKLEGESYESDMPQPRNFYSASKAAAENIALSYYHTHGLPTIITRGENTFGPFQGTEKVIPTFVRKALNNQPLPIYGNGNQSRMWLSVNEHVNAILHLILKGKTGEIYNIGTHHEMKNIDLAKFILKTLKKPKDLIEFIDDTKIRPGHDKRYCVNTDKLKSTGWHPIFDYDVSFKSTILWYQNNWWL